MAESLEFSEGIDVKHISDHYLSIINKFQCSTQQNFQRDEDVSEDEIKETEELTLLEMAEDLCDIFSSLNEQKQKLKDMRINVINDTFSVSRKDMDDLSDEIKRKFSQFKMAYKNCENCLEDILERAEKEQTISNVQKSGQGRLCTLFSISHTDLYSYNLRLESSKRSFHVFEMNANLELISLPFPNYPYNTVISAINEVAVACEELTSIAFKLLNLD